MLVEACKVHAVTPALEAICEANVYLSGVGADNVNCAAAHSFYNGVTSLGIKHADHGCCVALGTLVQLVLEGAPKEEFEEVQNFCLEVGLPVGREVQERSSGSDNICSAKAPVCHFLQIGFRDHVVFVYRIHTRIVQCHIHIILNLAVFHKEIAAPLIPVIFTV